MINLRSVLADYAFTFSEALSTIQILPGALAIILPQVVLSPSSAMALSPLEIVCPRHFTVLPAQSPILQA